MYIYTHIHTCTHVHTHNTHTHTHTHTHTCIHHSNATLQTKVSVRCPYHISANSPLQRQRVYKDDLSFLFSGLNLLLLCALWATFAFMPNGAVRALVLSAESMVCCCYTRCASPSDSTNTRRYIGFTAPNTVPLLLAYTQDSDKAVTEYPTSQ